MSRSITPEPTPSQTLTVSTAAGFNAGDLVYFNGSTGDYGTPTPTTQTSVSVPVTGSTALLGGITGANATNVGIYGGCSTSGFSAILTNGNIVQVFFTANTNYPSFRVVSSAGAIVVAETSMSTTFTQSGTPCIAVAALTGGGFAAAWINDTGGTTNRPTYAVYSNAGVVVSAAQQDTGGNGASNPQQEINIKPTPSGGFIISYYGTATSVINARGYAANGTSAFSWVSLTAGNVSQVHGLAVRSNGDFLLTGCHNSASTVYAIWSSVGVAVVGSTSFATTNGTSFNSVTSADCLSDGTTFVIAYAPAIGNNTLAFRFLPTGNVLGAEFYIPSSNFKGAAGTYYYVLNVTALTGNKFILLTAVSSGPVCYAVFDSTGACLSGTSGTTSTAAVPINIPQAYFQFSGNQITALESPSGFISLYYTNTGSSKNYSMQASTIDTTTYALVNVTPSTQTLGSTTAAPVAYAPSGSTPLSAAFTIAPGNVSVAGTFGAIIKNPEIVYSSVVTSISTTTLPDGRVLVAYATFSNAGNIYVAVYSIAGVLTETLTIATGASYTSAFQPFSKISISALSSGKFVIAYSSASAAYSVKLYSSTFTQIGSTVTLSVPGTGTSGYVASVSGLTGDRYVVVYSGTTNYPNYRVYDNTNTQLVGDTVMTSVDMKYLTVCGYSGGGFFVAGTLTTNVQQSAQFGNPSGNTFTNTQAFAVVTNVATPIQNVRAVANTHSTVYVPYSASATQMTYYGSSLASNTGSGLSGALSGLTSVDSSAVGVTGTGAPVGTAQIGAVMQLFNGGIDTTVALSATLVQPYTATKSSQNSMTPSYGPNVGIAYIDVNQKVNYMIVCGSTFPTKATVTSTTPSTAINIYPGTTSASPAIQNTVFTGVALQTVPAGGAGAVQIDGPAQLNSNYPAGTTYRAFDHQGQGVPGVKGNIIGRAITLQGT